MSFEISERDMMGRIGILEVKNGALETPALFPVVNPLTQEIPPRFMLEELGCDALIANAYLIRRRAGSDTITDIHDFLDFPGIVATDSGAYQMLRYGEVEVSPSEIIRYEESIETDIGVILDVPTGARASKTHAIHTVNETIRRADEAQSVITRRDMAWVGPIQGGQYLDLVAYSAREMSKRNFDIYALGSPTEVMEQYLFGDLIEMILAAKMNLPSSAPFHLFGAGHPFMLALAVALGCDMFDSAAYILYARRGRYLTQAGTLQLGQMEYFPCRCRTCAGSTPDEVRARPAAERIRFLAEHNLSACSQEIAVIKEAIVEGRLWELVERRSRSHPSLLEALRRTGSRQTFIARSAPSTKRRGILYFDSTSLSRPEYATYLERLTRDYLPPRSAKIAVLLPRSKELASTADTAARLAPSSAGAEVHVCLYSPPYGIVPSELENTFPFSQTEGPEKPDPETMKAMVETVSKYFAKNKTYRTLVLVHSEKDWEIRFARMCGNASKRLGLRFQGYSTQELSQGRIRILSRKKRHLQQGTGEVRLRNKRRPRR